MTIDAPATLTDVTERHDELVQFVYRAAAAARLVANARSLLAAAPSELADSFEQAVRASEFAS